MPEEHLDPDPMPESRQIPVTSDTDTKHASARKATDVWVIVNPRHPGIPVAGLTIPQRWKRIFEDVELDVAFHVQTVELAHLAEMIETRQDPVWLADGAWVMETLAAEIFWEDSAPCADNELQWFSNALGRAPLACAGPVVLRRLAERLDPQRDDGLVGLLSKITDEPGIDQREHTCQGYFWQLVIDERSARQAEWGLLRRLRMRPGGLVAQYLNRPISIRISRLLVNRTITPNQTTIGAFLVGLLGIAFVFIGQYWSAVLGTFLLHINSILDGVDGELAILRHQRSEFGGYLDSICDEVLNALILVAAGYYLFHSGRWIGYLYMGALSGFMSFFYALIHWHCKIKHGLGFYWWWDAYKPRKKMQREMTAYFYLKKLFCKDSTLLIFFMATIFDLLQPILWITTAVAAVAVVLFIIHIGIQRARW